MLGWPGAWARAAPRVARAIFGLAGNLGHIELNGGRLEAACRPASGSMAFVRRTGATKGFLTGPLARACPSSLLLVSRHDGRWLDKKDRERR